MTETIARGDIEINLNDNDVVAGLARVEAEFDRTTRKIDHTRAVAEITAELGPLDDKVAQAKRKLKKLEGEKATVRVDANTEKLDRKILNAKRAIKRLDGDKAVLEIKLKGVEKVLAAEAKMAAADDARAKAFQKNAKDQERVLDKQAAKQLAAARAEQKASDDRIKSAKKEAAAYRENDARAAQASRERQNAGRTEAAAYRENDQRALAAAKALQRQRDYNTRGIHRDVAGAIELQRQYAKLTDKLEALEQVKKRTFGREAKAKVELDAAHVLARMRMLKAELNAVGAHPPVEIKADLDRKGLKGVALGLKRFTEKLGTKAAGLSGATVRLGPFTSSIRGVGLALGLLGPTITDLLGSTSALVGVLGAGMAGAATLGSAGIVGLGGAFLGLKFSLRNTNAEIHNARLAINKFQKAEEGGDPKKIKETRDAMNATLKNISPLAREAAVGVEKFYSTWDKHTATTRKNLGTIAKQGFAALNQLTPMWAARTNEMSGMLAKGLGSAFKFLGGGQGKKLLGGIFKDFNAQIPTLLSGLGAFGHAFLNFAREGARNFGVLAGGFDNLGQKLLNFTQSDTFGATVKRWVTYAQDLMRFFGAAGRVMMHFFGDGSQAGDRFLNIMTKTLNRWDDFLTSASGKNQMSDFFNNSVDGTRALYNALKPIIHLFVLWSTGLEPVVAGITNVVAGVTSAFEGLGRIVGLGKPLHTLGVTIGTIFAVSKMAAFVQMLSKAAGLIKGIVTAGSLGGMFKGLANFLPALKSGGGILAAGEGAAAAMGAAITEAGAVAAAEIGGAIVEAGGVAAIEEAAGGAAGGLVAAGGGAAVAAGGRAALGAASAGEVAAAEASAAAITAEGVAAETTGAILLDFAGGPVAWGVTALAALVIAFGDTESASDKVNKKLKEQIATVQADADAFDHAGRNVNTHVDRIKSLTQAVKDAEKAAKNAKDGTVAQREAELHLYDVRQKLKRQIDAKMSDARVQQGNAKTEITDAKAQIATIKDMNKAEIEGLKAKRDKIEAMNKEAGMDPHSGTAWADTQGRIDAYAAQQAAALAAAQEQVVHGLNDRAAAALNVGRAERNMKVVTGRPAQSLGALARSGIAGKQISQSISLKYRAPSDVGAIAAASRRALQAGVGKGVILNIIAHSKNAEEALRRINTKEVRQKMLKFGITGHGGVLSKLDAIDRKAIRQKIAKIIERGGNPTIDTINKIIAKQIRDKPFKVTGEVGQALANISLVLAGLSQAQSKSITITTNHVNTYSGGPGSHASGLALGGERHNALIGEGGGPEWHVNPKTGRAYKTAGPMFTRLGPDDAIIPTEPTYRQRGREILSSIAKDLGMSTYRHGKHHRAHKKPPTHAETVAAANAGPATPAPTTGSATSDASANKVTHLPRPADYRAAAVPIDLAQGNFERSKTKLGTARDNLDTAKQSLKDSEHLSKKDSKPGANDSPYHKDAKHRTRLEKRIKEIHDNIHKKGGFLDDFERDKKRLGDLNKANAEITHLNQVIATDGQFMTSAATRYETSHSDADLRAWTTARDDRGKMITKLQGILKKALEAAKSIHGPGEQALRDGLVEQLAGLDPIAADNAQDPPSTDKSVHDLEWLLKSRDEWGSYQTDIANIAVDKSQDIPKDADLAKAAAEKLTKDKKALVDLLTGDLTAAQATGNSALITETADALSSAKADLGSTDGSNEPTLTYAGQAALTDAEFSGIAKGFGSNAQAFGGSMEGAPGLGAGQGMQMNPAGATISGGSAAGRAFSSSAGSGGSQGYPDSGSSSNSGNTYNVNNTFAAPPPDPHTWSRGVEYEFRSAI